MAEISELEWFWASVGGMLVVVGGVLLADPLVVDTLVLDVLVVVV